jgi:hypothetical protein
MANKKKGPGSLFIQKRPKKRKPRPFLTAFLEFADLLESLELIDCRSDGSRLIWM